MNNEQLESYLKKLKSSSSGPDVLDDRIEERIMKEFSVMKSNRSRMRRVAIVFSVLLICGTGFVAAGGDAAVKNYISSGSETDASGNPIPDSESLWTYLLRHVHEHLRSHVHGPRNQMPKSLIEVPSATQAE